MCEVSENVCRSCLKKSNETMRKLSDCDEGLGMKLSDCYMICTKVDIESCDDGLTILICVMCELALKTAFYFQKQSQRSNEKLIEENLKKSNLCPTNYCETKIEVEDNETTSDKKVILHESCNLESSLPTPVTNSIMMPTQSSNFKLPVVSTEVVKKYYECSKCSKKFISKRHLETHSKHHMNHSYECEVCGRKLASRAILKIHLKNHLTRKKPSRSHSPPPLVTKTEQFYGVEYLM